MSENVLPNRPVTRPHQRLDVWTHEVAVAQRRVLLSVLVTLFSNVLLRAGSLPATVSLTLFLAVAGVSMWCVYKLATALSTPRVPLWTLAMLIPWVGFVCLAVLNQRATRYLRSRGVTVGLLGAKT